MKRLLLIIAIIAAVVCGCAAPPPATPPEAPLPEPVPAPAPEPVPPPEPEPAAGDCLPGEVYIPAEEACYCQEIDYDKLYAWLGSLTDDFFIGDEDFSEFGGGEEELLVTYRIEGNDILDPRMESVSGDLLPYQEDADRHRDIWGRFAALIPSEDRGFLSSFAVFTDGAEGTLAAVEPDMEGDPTRWVLLVDIADADDTRDLTYTLIHEYGHILTLNSDQLEPDIDLLYYEDEELYQEAAEDCPRYFTWEGCSRPDSYLDEFYNRFWADIYDEWLEIDTEPDDDIYYERMEDFYFKYETSFVNDHAATNPEEDIAESWSFFILEPKPAGDTTAGEKVLFFYQHTELVELRAQILARLCSLIERM